ncbi:MAG: hypothetical protein Q7T48_05705 [Cellvibrio sp.]|uniref:hypothetical protein n=1 Tax=Cellvibrio sp. TaxID=1965322 RepID=UPI0027202ADB|nr:hypothetical protein [Cellvibrio sp.]
MKKLFFAVCLLMFASSSTASALSCGKARAVVTDAESAGKPYFTVAVTNANISKSYQFTIVNDFINVSCDNRPDGSLVFVIRHFCGGSGCSDLNFGIIDANSGEVILTPSDRYKGNAEKAKAIMGREIKPTGWRENNQEIYLRSAIELG